MDRQRNGDPVATSRGHCVAGGASNTRDRSRTSNSVRNLTVIVKFNPDKTVRDYSVRQSTF